MEIQDLVNIGYTPEEAKKIIDEGIKRKNSLHNFNVIVQYDRGLGKEFIQLNPVFARDPNEALRLAEKQAEEYFKLNKGEVKEVKVKPYF